MHSSTSSFERPTPDLPWRGILLAVAGLTLVAGAAWEIRCRAWGFGPTLNDTPDLWAQRRDAVRPDSLVIIGDSRAWFDLDLDQLEHGLGRRPVQLAIPGSCAYPVLANLADDASFHGTVICSIIPLIYLAPGGPLVEHSEEALKRYKTRTLAQRASHQLGMIAEEHLAFLKEGDLDLDGLLKEVPWPKRAGTGGPRTPPYFNSVDRERRARMVAACEQPGPLQDRVKFGWPPLFTAPPPPSYVPREAFLAQMGAAVEARFKNTTSAVQRIRARGGQVIFVRFPVTGELKKLEDAATPRAGPWTRILKESGAPGIYFEDFPELASFVCPEWSHLSAADSIEFTLRLVPHLRQALAQAATPAGR